MTIKQIYKKYPDQWVLAKVLKQNKKGKLVEAKPLFASKNRDEMYNAIKDVPDGEFVATLYTGKILGEGQAFAF